MSLYQVEMLCRVAIMDMNIHVSESDLFSCHWKWRIEPLLKCGTRLEYGGQEDIEETPQLWETVL